MSQSRYARILLGDLRADYRIRLLNASGQTVATSDRSGKANEEIYRQLAVGTYYVTVDAPHGQRSASPYVLRWSTLPEGLILLSQRVYGSGTSRELDYEVLNNTSHAISGVTERFSSSCTHIGPVDCGPGNVGEQFRVIPPRARASFFTTMLPSDMAGWTFKVESLGTTSFVSQLSIKLTGTQSTTGGTKYTGTWTNATGHTVSCPTMTRNAYDARGALLQQMELSSPHSSYAAHYTVQWRATVTPSLPSGTARTSWGINEVAPGPGCG